MISLYAGIFLLLLALLLLLVSRKQQGALGLPGGNLVTSDTRDWGAVEKPLYDAELELTGRPDYLVEKNGAFIPVEVKSGRTPAAPYDSHIFQVAAYCLLVERSYGKRPPFGLIHYPNRDFSVDYTPELESALLDLLAEIRRDERRRSIPRSHEEKGRCLRCGYRSRCDQRIH